MNICENRAKATLCPCTFNCPNHGKCCACVAHHRDNDEGVRHVFFQRKQKLLMTGV